MAQNPTLSNKGRFELDYVKGCAPLTVEVEVEHYSGPETVSYAVANENEIIDIFSSKRPFILSSPGIYKIIQNITGLDNPDERRDTIRVEVLETIAPQVQINNCGNGVVTVKALQGPYDYFIVDGNPSLRLDATNNFERRIPYDPPGLHQISVQGMYEGPGAQNNCEGSSREVEVRESLLPAASISELKANVQDNSITLRYELLPDVQYLLEVQENGTGNFTSLGTPEGNEYSLSGKDLSSNFYCFRIRIINPCDPSYIEPYFYSNTVCTTELSGRAMDNGNQITFKTLSSPARQLNLFRNGEELQSFEGVSPFLDREVNCSTTYEYAVQISYGNALSLTEGLSLTTGLNATLPKPENIASFWDNQIPVFKVLLPYPPEDALYSAYFADQEEEDLVSSSDNNLLRLIGTESNCFNIEYSDACGNTSARSENICALYLRNTSTEPDGLQLEWNEYNGYINGVSQYVLEEYNAEGSLVQSTEVGLRTSIDLGEQPVEKSGFYYLIKAIPTEGSLEESSSNPHIFQIVMKPYFPNTFIPEGESPNNVFRALGKFVESGSMEIFNRWGAAVFKTNELDKGWDGTINGEIAPQGTYYYKALVHTEDGTQHSSQGTVFLMRR